MRSKHWEPKKAFLQDYMLDYRVYHYDSWRYQLWLKVFGNKYGVWRLMIQVRCQDKEITFLKRRIGNLISIASQLAPEASGPSTAPRTERSAGPSGADGKGSDAV